MISIFKTGEFDYSDMGINKPVRYNVNNLIDVASRTSKIDVTDEHTKNIISTMSNFIVEDGLLKAEEPNNLELKGMGFSPVFEFDLLDMGDYYEPTNIIMKEIGYTKTPRTKIVYNSIIAPNSEVNNSMDDTEIQKLVKRNNELQEQIGVFKNENNQLKKAINNKDKEIKKIKDSYSDTDKKLAEYEKLKEIESNYNSLISSKRDDLIYQICGDDESEKEKYKDYSISQLENTVDLLNRVNKKGKGITPMTQHTDDGNDPSVEDDDEDVYTDEQFEEDFKNSGL